MAASYGPDNPFAVGSYAGAPDPSGIFSSILNQDGSGAAPQGTVPASSAAEVEEMRSKVRAKRNFSPNTSDESSRQVEPPSVGGNPFTQDSVVALRSGRAHRE